MPGAGIPRALGVGCALLMVLSGLTMMAGADKSEDKVRVIVLFKEKVDKNMVEDCGGEITDTYDIIPGVVAEMTQSDIKELKKNDKIEDVEEDAIAEIQGQTTGWGITQIRANDAWSISKGANINVAVMDTGIDADHEDLKVVDGVKIIKGVTTEDVYNDDNGHGTHCAGIIAATNNDLGVVGVAYSASLYAIKVLDSGGSGYYTDMIKGLDWAISHGVQVVSMSFGGQTSTKAFESACKNAQSKGLVLVAAAGNGGNAKVLYPAAYSSVIAVGATDSSNARASWSSYGSQLDIMAPGVGIYSTYNDGGYTTLSGTSMACPHVSGTVALVLATTIPATYDANKNGKWDPTEVQNRLQKTATNLGTAGWDKYTGYGLVNAYAAVGGT